ncbi:PH domain-containing protein [Arthrobacter roseus]|uniref:PH domain-containing protein n=1 Tax=Arthrobacter roseus TaxID=136274 RepID=UPI0019639B7F|nr:PH domain-containing protein [Arthrobacter roseus]MBM7849212.1 hypothetical protein [Arthrobacter roseus]
MTNPQNMVSADVFRPRTSIWFTGLALVLVVIGLISSIVRYGAVTGVAGSWPLIVCAFLAWWLFWYPRIEVSSTAVTIHNPLQVIDVPWEALIDVDTRYALKLVTPTGRYTAWAAPAPGIFGTHRGRTEHVQGLPASTYGPAQSIRPGDLKNTDSGAAAYLVRSRWEAMANAGTIDIDATEQAKVSKKSNLLLTVVFVVLIVAGLTVAPLFY